MRNRREELFYIKGMLKIPAEIAEATIKYLPTSEGDCVYKYGYASRALLELLNDVKAVQEYIDEVL